MAIEIVDFPIKNGDFPLRTVSSPEGRFYAASAQQDHPVGSLFLYILVIQFLVMYKTL